MPDEKTGIATVGDLLDKLGTENPRVAIGDNQPPPEPTPFELVKKEIDDLYEEAKGWLDGEPIANEGQAAEIAELRNRIRAAEKRAEELRVAEKKPLDEQVKAVQDRYNPLIQKDKGRTSLALGALNKALAPYLAELDRQQRAAAAEAAAAAANAREEALAASRAAAESANLAEREAAEEAQKHAKELEKTARAAEQSKAQVRGTGGGRAIGMKTVYRAELTNPAEAIAYFRQMRPAELKAWMAEQAADMIRIGSKPPQPIPGFAIHEEKVPA